MKRKQYEYFITEVKGYKEDTLNTYGISGWELVNVKQYHGLKDNMYQLTFKREKIDEDEN